MPRGEISTFKVLHRLGWRRQEVAARGRYSFAQELPDGERLCCVDEA